MSTDEEQLETLWRAHAPAVLAYCRRRVATADDAYDVTAEAYLTAWRHIGSAPQDDGARLWLFTIAGNALANHRRSSGRRSALAERVARELSLVEAPAADGGHDHLVHEALAQLSEADRELVVLTSWDGLSATEVAQLLDISPTAVRVRLHRSRSRLKAHLRHLGVVGGAPPPAPLTLPTALRRPKATVI